MRAELLSLRPTHIFWGVALLLALVSTFAVVSIYRLLEQYSAATRTQQSILELDQFMSDLKDIETGSRGYAITRQQQFLEPYELGTATLGKRFDQLRALARTEDELAARLPSLKHAAEVRMGAAKKVVDLASRGAADRELVHAVRAGQAAMDDVRRQFGSVLATQENIHARRQQQLERQAVIASIALATGVAISLLLLTWLFGRLTHENARRRQVEEELRVLNTELEERVQSRTAEVQRTRDLLDAVVENIPDMILLKEPSGDEFQYLLVNKAGEELLGRDRTQILGKTEREIFPPDEAQEIVRATKAATESMRAQKSRRNLTTAIGVRSVEACIVPIVDDHGSKVHALAIVRDVTESNMRDEQIRQLQRLDSVGQLTGGIAHDFNNLLAVIMGSIELVCERLPKGSETADIADEALDATHRGAELVRRLLAFARKQHLEPTAVDMNDRLPGIVPMLHRTLGENIRVQVRPADQLWLARVDPTQVDDALVNLAINARDAMPNGGTLTIETANVTLDEDYAAHHLEVQPGEYVMLAVSDTGAGMPPEVVARAFEPFFTTKGEGHGTGLGLSQVYGWTKQSGGHIKIYSELGHGTTVKLYLPRASDEESAVGAAASDEVHRGDETILLVEDNPNVRRTAIRQLRDLGFSPIEAHDGDSALEIVRSGVDFDLLLTDVVMPGGMSGYELASEVEKLRPGTKVLFTSGYTELAANGLRTARKGPLISKPYNKRDLGRAIRSALDVGETG